MPASADKSTRHPVVSIGMPTYNGAKRIGKALDSIWNTGYSNLEIIICDNASTDETQELCEQIAREHPEVRYIRHKENLGIRRNFEFALHAATGDYFMWVSDDDLIEPDLFPVYIDFLGKNPDYSLVTGKIRYWVGDQFSHFEKVSLEHRSPARRAFEYYLWVRWGGLVHGLMRRETAQGIPLTDVYGYDWHYVANLAYCGKIRTIDPVGYNKHLGGSSGDWAKMAKQMREPFWVGRFPLIKLAIDACREFYRSPTFNNMPALPKLFTAISCSLAILYKLLPQAWRHNIKKEDYYKSVRPREEIINLREHQVNQN